MKTNVRAGTSHDITSREINNRSLARAIAAEGIVLLENDGALPLANKRIALFGAGARMTVKGGTGSGEVRERESTNTEKGLENAGYCIESKAWLDDFDAEYNRLYTAWRQMINEKAKWKLPFAVFDVTSTNPFSFPIGRRVTESDISKANTDTAIYVIARQAGEGTDRKIEKGDYLLSDIEYQNIKLLAERFKHTIIVINVGGMIDLSFMDEIKGINALVYFVQGGMEGGNALADILSGKVTPCGKLTDTWARTYNDYPNADTFSYRNGNLDEEDYTEGIYVGYRYFDSFNIKPRYEFGYGKSYTDFNIQVDNVILNKTEALISARVKNCGQEYEGKEVLQAYISFPSAGLPRESQQLVAFSKTDILKPDEEQRVDLSFSLTQLAAYNEEISSWVLEAGEYGLFVGNSSRNTQPAALLVLDKSIVCERVKSICPMTKPIKEIIAPKQDAHNLVFPKTIQVNANAFFTRDVCYESPQPDITDETTRLLKRLSIKDCISLAVGGGVLGKQVNAAPGAAGRTTMALWKKHRIPNIVLSDGPAGINVTQKIVIEKSGAQKLVDIPENYNFGSMRYFLRFMMSSGKRGAIHYQYATAWPIQTLLAQTWNLSLLEQMGRAVGDEMIEFGITLWLAPGMNIHRNPLCGRNFEYYSEDPFLTGKMAAAITRGVQSHKGIGVSIKHFACNNQEDNRTHVSSNLSERTLREIYLKGFGIAIRECMPMAVMTSYNKINGAYTANSHDLCTKVLRNEWGFNGFVMTDWFSTGDDKGSHPLCVQAGNDLIMPGTKKARKEIYSAVRSGDITREQLNACAANVLGAITTSAVYSDS